MPPVLFWSLFALWALICLLLDQMSRTPIFRSEDIGADGSIAEPTGDSV